MKPTCFLLLVFLAFIRLSLTVSAIDESKVKSYSILRRTASGPYISNHDVFTVNMKDGHRCAPDGQVYKWCNTFSADEHLSLTWSNRSSCSCTCSYGSQCFVPSLQTCIDATAAINFGGCKDSLDGEALLQVPINLGTQGNTSKADSFKKHYNCYLDGYYFDYSGFKRRWEMMTDSIFSLVELKNGPNKQFSVQWKPDTNGILSGRIILLKIYCNSSSPQNQPATNHCRLFKALGRVTYYSITSSVTQSSYPAAPTSVDSHVPLPSVTLPPPPLSSSSSSLSPTPSKSPSSSKRLPSPLLPPPSPSLTELLPQSIASTTSTKTAGLASTRMSSFSPSTHSQTRSLHTRPASLTSGPIVQTSKTELQSSSPFHSEEASNVVVSTGIPKHTISTVRPHPIKPSKSSLATKAASSSAAIDGPGNKEARANGTDNGAVIGAAVGGAVFLGILAVVIILFCKRRKLWKNEEKTAKLEVKNPVYGSSDIPLTTAPENQVTTSSDQDNQPTYQGLITKDGLQVNGSALYSSPENDYDNYTVYQSLDKKIPETPVYQSLKKGQAVTGKPNPKPKSNATGKPSERPKLNAEPVYNVLEQPDAEQGAMPEEVYEDPGRDNHGDTHDPLYNVLEGPDAEQNYEAPDVGDPLYNVLEGPESKQGPQEPLYNVLERSNADHNPSGSQGPFDGSKNESLYNVLERPDSAGPNKGGVGHAAPNGSTSADAHDNPAYEQSLELDAPYASVHRPGSQRESVYEPLRGPDKQDLYEPIS